MILSFDFSSPTPIYLQIRNQIVMGIAKGELLPGERLPTIRNLASESGINMMTVSKAYQVLKNEGHILIDRRRGAIIAPHQRQRISKYYIGELEKTILELKLAGMPKEEFMQLCQQLYDQNHSKNT